MRTLIENIHGRVIVDDDVFKWAQYYRWRIDSSTKRVVGYKIRHRKNVVSLPRVIMDAPVGLVVDHIDGNPLNNVRANLRICTQAENVRNGSIAKDNTTGYKGVSFRSGKWRAQICLNRKIISLGSFCDLKSAVLAYDAAALKLFGQFAKTNLPCEDSRSSCYA